MWMGVHVYMCGCACVIGVMGAMWMGVYVCMCGCVDGYLCVHICVDMDICVGVLCALYVYTHVCVVGGGWALREGVWH